MDEQEIVNEFLIESNENLARLDLEIVELEKQPGDTSLLASIFRTFHTIKGTCGFLGFRALEGIAHDAENLLSQLRNGERALTAPLVSLILESADAIRKELTSIEACGKEGGESYEDLQKRLQLACERRAGHNKHDSKKEALPIDAPPTTPCTRDSGFAPPAKNSAVADSTIRVDVGLLDRLMNLVGELVLARNQIQQFNTTQEDATFNGTAQRLSLITTELQEGIMKTRMQPIGVVWNKLPRQVRDLASASGKRVVLELDGAETELDRTIIEAIKDPLGHLVRNCCDHGIESPEARAQKGKLPEGRILLRAFHEGGQVNIEISDDGAGIDLRRVADKAVEKGVLRPEQAARMTDRELLDLVFTAGFSTAEKVTKVSGRGVGMDVVRTNIEKIGGVVDLISTQGQGTTVRIKIPLTLAIIPGLVITSGGERFVIPQVSLLELLRLESDGTGGGIERIHESRVYRRRGGLLPIVYLNEVLELQASAASEAANIVVLEADDRQFGLAVDGISDTQEIVVKPLGQELKALTCYAGSTILGDGSVALILDVLGIAQRANVVSERRQQAKLEAGGQSRREQRSQLLLLFRVANLSRLAVPLSLVARLEEFPQSALDHAAGGRVVQYRGQILPLVTLVDLLGLQASQPMGVQDPLPVIVFRDGDRQIGVVVDEIVDVVEDRITVTMPSAQPGLLGSAVVTGKIADLLDVHAVIQRADENWFTGLALPAARAHTILLAEGSAFSRSLIRAHWEMAGHHVVEASNAQEALEDLAQERVDAVAAALDLPGGGGFALLDGMRNHPAMRRIPAVALTARPGEEHRAQEGRGHDFVRYEAKFPCAPALHALEEAIAAARTSEVVPASARN